MYMLQLMSLKAIAVAGVGGVVRSLPSPFQLIHFDINLPPPPPFELIVMQKNHVKEKNT